VKDETDDLLADSHNTLNRWKSYFSQLLREIHTAEPLVPDLSPFEVDVAITKFERYKSPGSDKIPAELIQAGGETLWSEIHKLVNSIWNYEELPDQWK
jgi:hypothetical protein